MRDDLWIIFSNSESIAFKGTERDCENMRKLVEQTRNSQAQKWTVAEAIREVGKKSKEYRIKATMEALNDYCCG